MPFTGTLLSDDCNANALFFLNHSDHFLGPSRPMSTMPFGSNDPGLPKVNFGRHGSQFYRDIVARPLSGCDRPGTTTERAVINVYLLATASS